MCSDQTTRSPRFCTNCGREIFPGLMVCDSCHTQQERKPTASSDQSTAPSIESMTGWSVGLDKQDRPTVTIHLNKVEARAWAAWLMKREPRKAIDDER